MNVLKGIGVFLGVCVVLALLWWGGWKLAAANRAQEYQVNRNSQQYQVALIDAERARAADWDRAVDLAQKAAIAEVFCASYEELDPPTRDLQLAWARICIDG